VRDAGLGWLLLDCLRGRHYSTEEQAERLLLRHHLAEQNLFSEMFAITVVPLMVACDYTLSQMSFGENTISFGLDFEGQLQVLQMYAVLIGVEILNHGVVRLLLKRQLRKFRSLVVNIRVPDHTEMKHRRGRSSILRVDQVWNVQHHDRQYWAAHFWYCCAIIVFAVTAIIKATDRLNHEVSE